MRIVSTCLCLTSEPVLHVVRVSVSLAAQVMPLLFGSIGAEIDFKTIDKSLWPKAVLLVFVGAPPVMLCDSKQNIMLRK